MNKVEELLNASKINEVINSEKLNEIIKKLDKKEQPKKTSKAVIVFAVIGIIVAVAAAAYGIYRFFTPDYLDDFEDDFEDDFDNDFFEDEDEDSAAPEKKEETAAETSAEEPAGDAATQDVCSSLSSTVRELEVQVPFFFVVCPAKLDHTSRCKLAVLKANWLCLKGRNSHI